MPEIKRITISDLLKMCDREQEGLVIQGCGDSLEEWVGGINRILTEEGILIGGFTFTNVMTFTRKETTCLLFPFDDELLADMDMLFDWVCSNYDVFGCMSISGYCATYFDHYPPRLEEYDNYEENEKEQGGM